MIIRSYFRICVTINGLYIICFWIKYNRKSHINKTICKVNHENGITINRCDRKRTVYQLNYSLLSTQHTAIQDEFNIPIIREYSSLCELFNVFAMILCFGMGLYYSTYFDNNEQQQQHQYSCKHVESQNKHKEMIRVRISKIHTI